jgi:hypothetical protein
MKALSQHVSRQGALPEMSQDAHQYIASSVITTKRNFMSDVKRIALLSRDNAREAGRKVPVLADIEAAISDVLPTVNRSQLVDQPNGKRPIQKRCRPAAKPLPHPMSLAAYEQKKRRLFSNHCAATIIR